MSKDDSTLGVDLGDDCDGDLAGYDGGYGAAPARELDAYGGGYPPVIEGQAAALANARRTLDKAAAVLRQADEFLGARDHMNAALHLSARVLPTPLAAEVTSVLGAIDQFKAAHPE